MEKDSDHSSSPSPSFVAGHTASAAYKVQAEYKAGMSCGDGGALAEEEGQHDEQVALDIPLAQLGQQGQSDKKEQKRQGQMGLLEAVQLGMWQGMALLNMQLSLQKTSNADEDWDTLVQQP